MCRNLNNNQTACWFIKRRLSVDPVALYLNFYRKGACRNMAALIADNPDVEKTPGVVDSRAPDNDFENIASINEPVNFSSNCKLLSRYSAFCGQHQSLFGLTCPPFSPSQYTILPFKH